MQAHQTYQALCAVLGTVVYASVRAFDKEGQVIGSMSDARVSEELAKVELQLPPKDWVLPVNSIRSEGLGTQIPVGAEVQYYLQEGGVIRVNMPGGGWAEFTNHR